jgi:hypothetical protein
METIQNTLPTHSRINRIALVVALILMVPLVAMQFTDEVQWGVLDFVVMGLLLFGTGLLLDVIARQVKSTSARIILSVATLGVLFVIWAELAVDAVSQVIDRF